jgi:hypothetical protein
VVIEAESEPLTEDDSTETCDCRRLSDGQVLSGARNFGDDDLAASEEADIERIGSRAEEHYGRCRNHHKEEG